MRRITLFSLISGLTVCCLGSAAEVELTNGKTVSGIVISRPEMIGNGYVLTVRMKDSYKVYQFHPSRIVRIKSATDSVQILTMEAAIRKTPDAEGEIVRKFTPGLEVKVEKVEGDWAEVVPTAPALAEDKGWIRKDRIATEIDFSASLGREE